MNADFAFFFSSFSPSYSADAQLSISDKQSFSKPYLNTLYRAYLYLLAGRSMYAGREVVYVETWDCAVCTASSVSCHYAQTDLELIEVQTGAELVEEDVRSNLPPAPEHDKMVKVFRCQRKRVQYKITYIGYN